MENNALLIHWYIFKKKRLEEKKRKKKHCAVLSSIEKLVDRNP